MIDKFIKWHKKVLEVDNPPLVEMAQQHIDLLQELKDRRESDLRPCDKWVNPINFGDQMEHIESEYLEVEKEFRYISFNEPEANKDHLAEELVDLQMSCETMLAILGLDEQQRHDVRRKVIEKNRARNYYEPPDGDKSE